MVDWTQILSQQSSQPYPMQFVQVPSEKVRQQLFPPSVGGVATGVGGGRKGLGGGGGFGSGGNGGIGGALGW